MNELTKQLEQALKFTDKRINWSRTFRNGIYYEKDRLASLHASLLKCVGALEDIKAYAEDADMRREYARKSLDDLRKALEECK